MDSDEIMAMKVFCRIRTWEYDRLSSTCHDPPFAASWSPHLHQQPWRNKTFNLSKRSVLLPPRGSREWGQLEYRRIGVVFLSFLSFPVSSREVVMVSVFPGLWLGHVLSTCESRLWVHFVVQSLSRVWLCDPMDCSSPGFPVLHHLLEFAQTQVHWVGDAIQPSHLLLPLSSPPSIFSHYQGLFQWVGFHITWLRY